VLLTVLFNHLTNDFCVFLRKLGAGTLGRSCIGSRYSHDAIVACHYLRPSAPILHMDRRGSNISTETQRNDALLDGFGTFLWSEGPD
jgi:hypothetical protein